MASQPTLQIRPGTAADLPAVARVLVDTWRTTFAGLLPADFLDSLSYRRQEQRHRRTLRRPDTAYFVAEQPEDGAVLGFASGGPNRTAGLPGAGELYAIYVCAEQQARGVGSRLFRAVATTHLRRGRLSMVVWVLAINPARAFYETLGGRQVDDRLITLGSATVEEIAYAWDDLRAVAG